jgi:hypothetical protein
MGFRVSWIARCGTSTVELLRVSDRNLSGERHEFPDVGWYLLELPSDSQPPWVLLIADGSENYADLSASHAQSLSKGGNETLYFWCSDTVMATELLCFKDGTEAWSIRYDCADKTKQPAMNGEVPQIAHEVLRDLRTKQRADDGADYIYDLTAELGRSLIGFRHDADLEIDDPEPFEVLGEPAKQRHAWWQFWKR